jgi:hypothetical protein
MIVAQILNNMALIHEARGEYNEALRLHNAYDNSSLGKAKVPGPCLSFSQASIASIAA